MWGNPSPFLGLSQVASQCGRLDKATLLFTQSTGFGSGLILQNCGLTLFHNSCKAKAFAVSNGSIDAEGIHILNLKSVEKEGLSLSSNKIKRLRPAYFLTDLDCQDYLGWAFPGFLLSTKHYSECQKYPRREIIEMIGVFACKTITMDVTSLPSIFFLPNVWNSESG